MKKSTWLEDKISQYENDVEFLTEEKIIHLNEKIVEKMSQNNVSRAELAKRLNVSKAYISKVLSGNHNMTVKTMVSVAHALGCDINFDIYPKGLAPRTLYVFTNDSYKKYIPILEGVDYACAA